VQQSNYAQVGTVKDIAYFLGSFHLEKANQYYIMVFIGTFGDIPWRKIQVLH
jgi:hypothetical protein